LLWVRPPLRVGDTGPDDGRDGIGEGDGPGAKDRGSAAGPWNDGGGAKDGCDGAIGPGVVFIVGRGAGLNPGPDVGGAARLGAGATGRGATGLMAGAAAAGGRVTTGREGSPRLYPGWLRGAALGARVDGGLTE
jgi:hypothetical protein